MEDLHEAMDPYIKRHPNPKRGLKQQLLEAKPDIRPVTPLLPIDEMETRLEYMQKIEKGQRAFRKDPSWGFEPCQYATLMNLPLEKLAKHAQYDAQTEGLHIKPIGKFMAHFFQREQPGERCELSQVGFREPAGSSLGIPSSKDYDKHRCVVTGSANPQDCYIVPLTWNSTPELLKIAKSLTVVTRVFFSPDDIHIFAHLCDELGSLDKDWNIVNLSPQLYIWWSKGYFGLKYLDHKADEEPGMSRAELQFVWMPHSHYGKSKRIDLDKEKDKASNIRVCLEHMFGGETPCSPPCDRCTAISKVQAHRVRDHYTIESGYVFPVVRETKDIEKFKAMIQLQWAAICVGSMSGAANYPELLVGDEDDNDNDGGSGDDSGDYSDDYYYDDSGDYDDDDDNDNQPSLVAPVSNRIEDWLESVQEPVQEPVQAPVQNLAETRFCGW
ncbi:unnamed protein product [Clonostachys byssicola]|uniref:HNH nuclease domain-containing protein n=1 Tax=Clonostachys byssicola TaxID=160290 RepID=A0A9N9UA82_9HYPO|nr:unnamed protein product [Clonostachys byssicola]